MPAFQEGEFELIFVKILSGDRDESVVVGEIYRVHNPDENISLERYEAVLGMLQKLKKNIVLGTDQNFDYLKLQKLKSYKNYKQIQQLYHFWIRLLVMDWVHALLDRLESHITLPH